MAKKRKAKSNFTTIQQPTDRVLFLANTPKASEFILNLESLPKEWSVELDISDGSYLAIDGYYTLDVVTFLGQKGFSVLPCDADLKKFRKEGVMGFCEPTEEY